MSRLLCCVVVPVIAFSTNMPGAYAEPFAPTWESIDRRPNPKWFSEAKFGIFIHWGVYSVPSWGPKKRYAEWYWHDMRDKKSETWAFHKKTYGEDFKYQDFAPRFKAELYDPARWADTFARSGAKYVVLTSKHHDGFCMWPSHESWNWNSVDVGPHRDLAGDLMEAVRGRGLRAGFYFSMYEWYHPFYRTDVKRYVDQHMLPQMKDLVQRYKPDIIWPDGEWEHTSETWRSAEFLAWLYNESNAPKDVVVNDRWGKDCRNRHGGFATPEYGNIPKGKLIQAGRFEECQGMGHSFGYNRNEEADDYRTATELIHLLIDNVSRGGNLLLDIGPTADGRIPVIMQQRLLDMGKWLKVNGQAIFGTRKWRETMEGDHVRYTAKGEDLYAICLNWPGDVLELAAPKPATSTTATLIGHNRPLSWSHADGKLRIIIPPLTLDQIPSHHAHVIKLTEVK